MNFILFFLWSPVKKKWNRFACNAWLCMTSVVDEFCRGKEKREAELRVRNIYIIYMHIYIYI